MCEIDDFTEFIRMLSERARDRLFRSPDQFYCPRCGRWKHLLEFQLLRATPGYEDVVNPAVQCRRCKHVIPARVVGQGEQQS